MLARRWLARCLARCLVISALVGCGDEPPPAAAPPPPPPLPPPAPIVAPRAISSRAAFDLVALPEGAALAWGAPPDEGGGVRAIALEPRGAAVGHDVVVVRAEEGGSVDDVAAAPAGARLAVAWVSRVGSSLRVHASIASAGVERFAPPRALGPTISGYDRATRGRIAAWGRSDGTATVVHRMQPAACEASTGECARFSLHTLGAGVDGVEARDAHVNEVREPCEPLIVGGLARGTAFFYGACHLEGGEPSTTLYAIDPGGAGALASAPDVLAGCAPLGVVPGAIGAVAVGRCGDAIGAQEIGPRGDIVAGVREGEVRARCELGRPVLEVRSGQRGVRVALAESASRIEALLPDAIAPAGSRAVWTGDAVLVASPTGRDVAVRRYECDGDALVRTDVR